MKTIFGCILLFLTLSACSNGTENKLITCGFVNNTDEILKVILKNRQCPECLLNSADDELKSCPNDVALIRTAMGSAIRAKKNGDVVLKYFESLPTTESLTSGEFSTAAYYYNEIKDSDSAIKNYKKSLNVQEDPFIRLKLASLLSEIDRKDEAVQSLEKILREVDPLPKITSAGSVEGGANIVYGETAILLAENYVSLGKPEKAESIYRSLLAIYKNDFDYPDYLILTSEFLSNSKNSDKVKEAVTLRRQAEEILSKENPETRYAREEMKRLQTR
jgi:tetratricopeptide (TPR) repeat protein